MAPRRFDSLAVPRRDAVRFGGAWLGLNLLPLIPAYVTALPLSPYFPFCIEVLVFVTGFVYARGTRLEAVARWGGVAGVIGLLLYESYDAVVYTAFRRSGILYEDLELVDNLTYFVFDVGSWRMGGGMILGLLVVGGIVGAVHWGVRTVIETGRHPGCRMAVVAVHLVAWPLVVVVGPALDWGTPNLTYQTTSDQIRVRTVTTKALANAKASVRLRAMLDSMSTAAVDSAYFRYDALSLAHRPPIYVFAVESYGSILDRHPDLRSPYRRVLNETEVDLRNAGWDVASARLDVPVRGGRSWLAIASLLTGVRIERQLIYNRFQRNPGSVPHLVRFLDRQGYRTVALQPFTFPRPGLPVRNLYDFDVTLYRDDLDYNGPSYGLADAPDQYSLGFAHETHLAPSEDPFFLFFETVSSHSLWNYGLPPYLSDWHAFNQGDGSAGAQRRILDRRGSAPTEFLPDSMTAPRIFDQPMPHRYLQHIAYDLRVIRDYLTESAPEGSLVLLLGDHQPPLLDTQTDTVPLHILSTDSTLVSRVRRHGFTDGLTLDDDSATLRMEGVYSFLARLLAAQDGGAAFTRRAPADSSSLPRYRSEGVSPSLLVR